MPGVDIGPFQRIVNVSWQRPTHAIISVGLGIASSTTGVGASCAGGDLVPAPTGVRSNGHITNVHYQFGWVTPPLRGTPVNGVLRWGDTPQGQYSLTGAPTSRDVGTSAWQWVKGPTNQDYVHFESYRAGGTGIGVPGLSGEEFQPSTTLKVGVWDDVFTSGPYCSGSTDPDIPGLIVADVDPAAVARHAEIANLLSGVTLKVRRNPHDQLRTCNPVGIWTGANAISYALAGPGSTTKESPHSAFILYAIGD